jgi:hypothetical protein
LEIVSFELFLHSEITSFQSFLIPFSLPLSIVPALHRPTKKKIEKNLSIEGFLQKWNPHPPPKKGVLAQLNGGGGSQRVRPKVKAGEKVSQKHTTHATKTSTSKPTGSFLVLQLCCILVAVKADHKKGGNIPSPEFRLEKKYPRHSRGKKFWRSFKFRPISCR